VTPPDPGPVFQALADPTRREVLALVADGRARTATELAAALPVTRQAVAKHLAVLEGARLVDAERAGRQTRFHATPGPLTDAMAWMAEVGGRWDARLDRLRAAAIERERR
jgi:ArsR family transcriptional regulator, cadmium/lead-responsive transcriptional repressor